MGLVYSECILVNDPIIAGNAKKYVQIYSSTLTKCNKDDYNVNKEREGDSGREREKNNFILECLKGINP